MWILLAGILGLLIGSFVNVVAYRLPAGISLLRPSQCPHCAAPIRPWQNIPVISWLILRARCASCSAPISARYPAVEIVTAVLFAALAGYLPLMGLSGAVAVAAWIAYAWFAASSVVLVLIDLDTRRLPDAVVWPSLGVGLLAFVIAWPLGADTWALPRALAGMAIMFACYFLIRFIRPDGMGAATSNSLPSRVSFWDGSAGGAGGGLVVRLCRWRDFRHRHDGCWAGEPRQRHRIRSLAAGGYLDRNSVWQWCGTAVPGRVRTGVRSRRITWHAAW